MYLALRHISKPLSNCPPDIFANRSFPVFIYKNCITVKRYSLCNCSMVKFLSSKEGNFWKHLKSYQVSLSRRETFLFFVLWSKLCQS